MKSISVYLLSSFFLLIIFSVPGVIANSVTAYSVPKELKTDCFTVTVNGTPVQVGLATEMIFFTNFDFTGSVQISVTASSSRYWENGVIISPMVRRIFPTIIGRTLTFTLTSPGKFTIERPGNRKIHNEGGGLDTMLCVFANPPEGMPPDPKDTNVIYLGPGTHTRHIDLHSNQTLYVHGDALLKGSVNVWDAENARIFGRGVILFSDPAVRKCMTDEGSRNKNTRPLTSSNAKGLSIDGVIMITKAVRWQVLLNSSSDVSFNNVKLIGFQEGQTDDSCIDGIDFRGTGLTINDSFLRCGDNVFGAWGNRITITNCYCWTRLANIAMIAWGWSSKNSDLIVRDCDIVHLDAGRYGTCLGLYQNWAKGSGGYNNNVLFENLRCENLGSICGINTGGKLTNHVFRNIWLLNPPTSDHSDLISTGTGTIDSIVFEKIRYVNTIVTTPEAANIKVEGNVKYRFFADSQTGEPTAIMKVSGNGPVIFNGIDSYDPDNGKIVSWQWDFGDGESESGMTITHSYDKPGNYRVFLTVTDNDGKSDMTTLILSNINTSPLKNR